MKLTHKFEEMTPEKRPQDPYMDGTGLRFETLEHGGDERPDCFLIPRRECPPVPKSQKIVDLALSPAMILGRERIDAGIDADVANKEFRALDEVCHLINVSPAKTTCGSCHRRAPSLPSQRYLEFGSQIRKWPSLILAVAAGLTCAILARCSTTRSPCPVPHAIKCSDRCHVHSFESNGWSAYAATFSEIQVLLPHWQSNM
jgi:hypothetical protein